LLNDLLKQPQKNTTKRAESTHADQNQTAPTAFQNRPKQTGPVTSAPASAHHQQQSLQQAQEEYEDDYARF
jgi:hypothetical protein